MHNLKSTVIVIAIWRKESFSVTCLGIGRKIYSSTREGFEVRTWYIANWEHGIMASDSKDTVKIEYDKGVAWVSFNRPEKRNAMSPELALRMLDVFDEVEVREDIGVMVLTGEGTAFSAGMDIKEMAGRSVALFFPLFLATLPLPPKRHSWVCLKSTGALSRPATSVALSRKPCAPGMDSIM
jgi:hypothetical protein